MKELYSQSVLGERIAKKCGTLDVYIPLIDTLERDKIDFPLVPTEASFFEKGLKFSSEKMGAFILLFSDVVSCRFLYGDDKGIWSIFTLKENIFFAKLAQPLFCIRFSGQAQVNIFMKLKETLTKFGLEALEDTRTVPDFMQTGFSLKGITYNPKVTKIAKAAQRTSLKIAGAELQAVPSAQPPQPAPLEGEIEDPEDFLTYADGIQQLQVISCNDSAIIQEVDAVIMAGLHAKFDGPVGKPEIENYPTHEERINLFLIVGPPFSGKRAFSQSVWSLRTKFPGPSGASYVLVSYEDEELTTLTSDDFLKKITDQVSGAEQEEDNLQPGDWVICVVPHTISHLELINTISKEYSKQLVVRSCVAKLNLNDFYTKNQTPPPNLRQYLAPGYVLHAYVDSEGMEDLSIYSSRMDLLGEAFPHIRFHEVTQNKLLWNRLSYSVVENATNKLSRERMLVAHSYNRLKYSFQDKVIKLDYRIPILEENLHYFREVVINYEGALLQPEVDLDAETKDASDQDNKASKFKVQDMLLDSIRKLKSLMRGLIAKRDQGDSLPFITRLKGIFRFEGKLEKGPYSLHLSPYGFYFNSLGIETTVEKVEKSGLELYKCNYSEDFSIELLGFYIYGRNLDPKTISVWMNKNLLPRLPVQKSLKRSDITVDMRRQIEVQKRDWGLEGSGFFDGYFFRDIMGNILSGHPRGDEILEEHIREHNEKALEHNNQLKEKEKIRRKFYQSN